MKKITYNISCFLLCFILAGCVSGKDTAIDMDRDRTLTVKAGDTFKVNLKENPTTGYLWEVIQPETGRVLKLADKDEYVRDSEAIGSGGIRAFEFVAEKKGKEEVVFEYRRPWEKNKPPARKYVLSVRVL